jgi:hypothetical protein
MVLGHDSITRINKAVRLKAQLIERIGELRPPRTETLLSLVQPRTRQVRRC